LCGALSHRDLAPLARDADLRERRGERLCRLADTRQDRRSAIEPSIRLRSTQPIETLLTEPRRSSVTCAPTVSP